MQKQTKSDEKEWDKTKEREATDKTDWLNTGFINHLRRYSHSVYLTPRAAIDSHVRLALHTGDTW